MIILMCLFQDSLLRLEKNLCVNIILILKNNNAINRVMGVFRIVPRKGSIILSGNSEDVCHNGYIMCSCI